MLWFWLQRLSNLRISSNFNLNLCLEVTKACVRVGALDFGKTFSWKVSFLVIL